MTDYERYVLMKESANNLLLALQVLADWKTEIIKDSAKRMKEYATAQAAAAVTTLERCEKEAET